MIIHNKNKKARHRRKYIFAIDEGWEIKDIDGNFRYFDKNYRYFEVNNGDGTWTSGFCYKNELPKKVALEMAVEDAIDDKILIVR